MRAAQHCRSAGRARAVALLALVASVASLVPHVASARVAPDRIPFVSAVVQVRDEHAATIAWRAPGVQRVDVYAGTSLAGIDRTRAVAHGGRSARLTVRRLPGAAQWYFALVPDQGAPLVLTDRSLRLAGAPNFRDVGGYRTGDGRWVRMGALYRSDRLDRLTDEDFARIAALNPALVVDLRLERERLAAPDRLPPGASGLVADVYADAAPGSDPYAGIATAADAKELLLTANRRFVSLPSARRGYAALLASVRDARGPVVYHCTAGKDRTGWGTAVLLTLLGVPRATVVADYLASNGYLVERNRRQLARLGADGARIEPTLWVRADYLAAAFDEVERGYGSFDAYASQALGIDAAAVAELRARYLVGSPD